MYAYSLLFIDNPKNSEKDLNEIMLSQGDVTYLWCKNLRVPNSSMKSKIRYESYISTRMYKLKHINIA